VGGASPDPMYARGREKQQDADHKWNQLLDDSGQYIIPTPTTGDVGATARVASAGWGNRCGVGWGYT
jgi:hypothetical protein